MSSYLDDPTTTPPLCYGPRCAERHGATQRVIWSEHRRGWRKFCCERCKRDRCVEMQRKGRREYEAPQAGRAGR